jgi:TfoX/Sxy family transcriptional regulator of competence genes
MASSLDTMQYIVDQAGLGSRLSYRKMFGEYALYVDGKVAALVCDDQLFLKSTPEGRQLLHKVVEAAPFPGARNFLLLAEELDDPERLAAVLLATAAALPEPKLKTKNKTKAKAKAKAAPRARSRR